MEPSIHSLVCVTCTVARSSTAAAADVLAALPAAPGCPAAPAAGDAGSLRTLADRSRTVQHRRIGRARAGLTRGRTAPRALTNAATA